MSGNRIMNFVKSIKYLKKKIIEQYQFIHLKIEHDNLPTTYIHNNHQPNHLHCKTTLQVDHNYQIHQNF